MAANELFPVLVLVVSGQTQDTRSVAVFGSNYVSQPFPGLGPGVKIAIR